MELIYGTFNPAKLESMRNMLKGLEVDITGLNELPVELVEPEESGNDPLANAGIKAESYYRQIRKPLFSCDSGLYFENVSDEDQPGVHIKRIHGQNLKDKEFIDYYGSLAAKYGGKITAYYKNSIYLVLNKDTVFFYDGKDIQSERFYIVERPHRVYKKGFPLDSISKHIGSNKYYYDLDHGKNDNFTFINGFRNFFINSLQLINNEETGILV